MAFIPRMHDNQRGGRQACTPWRVSGETRNHNTIIGQSSGSGWGAWLASVLRSLAG